MENAYTKDTHHNTRQGVSHQFLESFRSWTEISNNAETPGNRRDLHLLAVSLAGWSAGYYWASFIHLFVHSFIHSFIFLCVCLGQSVL